MQIKTTMRYHLIPLRMAIINKSTNNKCWQGCGESGRNSFVLLVGMQIAIATMERSRVVLKIKKDLPFDPEIPLLGINLKDPKTLIQNDINTPIYIAALFTIAKIWKQPKFHQQISG